MPNRKSTRPTRERIIDAAEHLLRTAGLVRTTTKEIAREAGCSEAALYKHYRSKEEIYVRVLRDRLPRLNPLLDELARDPGDAGVAHNLTRVAGHAVRFYAESFPITASLFAEPALRKRHFDGVRELGQGPHKPLEALAGYLRAERERGAIRADADVDAAAALLLGACAQRAFVYDAAEGAPAPESDEVFVAGLVRTLMRGLGGEG
ncbi:TetR/AcrR family transcriptional regulator [Streptomyces boncukensis]|uniref:TetR/AcrR family transcriptional regulator n=1 Tax=Streptomyces boncukensis TaxID=2711219 RepID=A0A6G4WPC0_9ACTN|nr:TetR/AcrR family transcriptional regulator [Streptomyces boncukensis]NGO66938.1 TetR/AcrR family transcriptional regulator [Streptomyces boncukensis]